MKADDQTSVMKALAQASLPFVVSSHVKASRARQDDPENHHLRRKPSGLYQIRVTVDRGPKFVGERIILGLGTRHLSEARERRDLVLEALRKAKLLAEGGQ